LSIVIITTGVISISAVIKTNHTLQSLNISSNPIGDEGIAVIAGALENARIIELNVCDCSVTVTGAKSLAAGLAKNQTIKFLSVSFNIITMDGAIAILEAAVVNGVCQHVYIDGEYRYGKVKKMITILKKRQDSALNLKSW